MLPYLRRQSDFVLLSERTLAVPAIQLPHATLTYHKSGRGPTPLLLFHGFGQTNRAFDTLMETLSDRYTLFSFDLFFHGESHWHQDEQPMEKKVWSAVIEDFLKKEAIGTFSVLGFSMGGKFALATLEAFPNRVKEIFLLAPDGIKTSFWYSLATYPVALRKLFKSLIDHPHRFHTIATWAHRLQLIDRGVLRFVELQMNTQEKRSRVYYSWVVFRHLTFDLKKIGSLINDEQISLTLWIGKYDKIITAANMKHLLQHVDTYRFETLDAGHNDLIAKVTSAFFDKEGAF